MQLNATTNAPEYRDALINWMAAFGKGVRETIRTQGRLLGQAAVRLTPPRNQAQGKQAVSRDLRRVFYGLENRDAFSAPVAVIKGQDYVKAFVSNGVVFGVVHDLFKGAVSTKELDQWHQSHRDHRGRVPADLKETDMGGWKQIRKMVIPSNVLEAYVRQVQDDVGRGRAGWGLGVQQLGGTVPAWVGKHTSAVGKFIDGIQTESPYVQFENESEWAGRGDDDRVMRNAIESRIRDVGRAVLAARKEAGRPFA